MKTLFLKPLIIIALLATACSSEESLSETPANSSLPVTTIQALLANSALNSGNLSRVSNVNCPATIWYQVLVENEEIALGAFPINGEYNIDQTFEEGIANVLENLNNGSSSFVTASNIHIFRISVVYNNGSNPVSYIFNTDSSILNYFENCLIDFGEIGDTSQNNQICNTRLQYPIRFTVADALNPLNNTIQVIINNDVELIDVFLNNTISVIDTNFPITVTTNNNTFIANTYQELEVALNSNCQ